MPDPFESSRWKIDRAKHHVKDLRAEVDRFRDKNPYEIIVEKDASTGYDIHKCRLTERPSSSISLIIGDCVTNLRAALDHMIYSIATLNGATNPVIGTCSFPFARTPKDLSKRLNGLSSVPKDILTLLEGFRTYKGGDQALGVINDACNLDKHAMVTPIVIAMPGIRVTKQVRIMSLAQNPFWDRSNNEIELFRSIGDPDYECDLTLDVGLDRPLFLQAKPVISLLNHLIGSVERVLMILEAESRRLFPTKF